MAGASPRRGSAPGSCGDVGRTRASGGSESCFRGPARGLYRILNAPTAEEAGAPSVESPGAIAAGHAGIQGASPRAGPVGARRCPRALHRSPEVVRGALARSSPRARSEKGGVCTELRTTGYGLRLLVPGKSPISRGYSVPGVRFNSVGDGMPPRFLENLATPWPVARSPKPLVEADPLFGIAPRSARCSRSRRGW